jgi:hypothetical protein
MTRIDMPGYGLLTEPPSASDWPTCACCGTELPADGSWCAECEAAECGEADVADASGLCAAELLRRGWEKCRPSVEPVTLKGGAVKTCRIEVWRMSEADARGRDGRHTYGRILEVLS